MLARPMLVPAVGEALASWTVPGGSSAAKSTQSDEGPSEPPPPRRTGMFTPAEPQSEAVERQTYADDMRGEELETHLTERLGQLHVSGRDNIASVMGDVMRLLGGHGALGIDTLSVGLAIAQALGVRPSDDRPPVRDDLSRFGVFIDQAARLGLSPQQTERVAREINQTPDRRLTDESRSPLIQQMVSAGASRDEAEREVTRLEVTARLLPDTLTAHGLVNVSPQIDVTVNAPTPDGGRVYSVTPLSDTAQGNGDSVVGSSD